MLKKSLALFLIIFFQINFASHVRAEDESLKTGDKEIAPEGEKKEAGAGLKPGVEEKAEKEIRGRVTGIAEDETYIKIGDIKIITSRKFLKDSFVSAGDNIVVMVEETPEGLKALDFKYIYDESDDSSDFDDDTIKPVEYDIGISGE